MNASPKSISKFQTLSHKNAQENFTKLQWFLQTSKIKQTVCRFANHSPHPFSAHFSMKQQASSDLTMAGGVEDEPIVPAFTANEFLSLCFEIGNFARHEKAVRVCSARPSSSMAQNSLLCPCHHLA